MHTSKCITSRFCLLEEERKLAYSDLQQSDLAISDAIIHCSESVVINYLRCWWRFGRPAAVAWSNLLPWMNTRRRSCQFCLTGGVLRFVYIRDISINAGLTSVYISLLWQIFHLVSKCLRIFRINIQMNANWAPICDFRTVSIVHVDSVVVRWHFTFQLGVNEIKPSKRSMPPTYAN